MLQVDDLSVSYGQIKALWAMRLRVDEREIVALIGANGAGKSTFLGTCVGLLRASEGHIVFNGADIGGMKTHQIVRNGLVLVPEGRRIFPALTVEENLLVARFGARKSTMPKAGKELAFNLFPRLVERRNQKAGTLSGGEQQMLALARGLVCEPKMLLLDEPSLGLAPLLVDHLFDKIKVINEQGCSILLVEQNAFLAMAVSNRTYVLQNGHIVLEGTSEKLAQMESIKESYLGGTIEIS